MRSCWAHSRIAATSPFDESVDEHLVQQVARYVVIRHPQRRSQQLPLFFGRRRLRQRRFQSGAKNTKNLQFWRWRDCSMRRWLRLEKYYLPRQNTPPCRIKRTHATPDVSVSRFSTWMPSRRRMYMVTGFISTLSQPSGIQPRHERARSIDQYRITFNVFSSRREHAAVTRRHCLWRSTQFAAGLGLHMGPAAFLSQCLPRLNGHFVKRVCGFQRAGLLCENHSRTAATEAGVHF